MRHQPHLPSPLHGLVSLPAARELGGPHAWRPVARLDRAVERRVNALRAGPRVDAAAVALSTAADRSVLWGGASAVLWATGRRGRRAALRGYGSLLVASAVANLAGKVLLGGDRPDVTLVPGSRRLRRHPVSPAFPSGHAASAAAFAVGASLEAPAAAAALVPLAGAVAWSRLHVGAHWTSDVVAGAALGAGVALLGRVLVPAPPHAARVVPAGAPVALPALPDGAGLVVVVNPASGPSVPFGTDVAAQVRATLPAATVHELGPDDDVADLLDGAAAGGARALGVSGGDGTVAAAAARARAHDLPLLVLPGGTLNHFARALGVEEVGTALRAAVAGTGVAVDVADLAVDGEPDRTVLNTFSVGVYPELVTERERWEDRLGKGPAALVAAARVLRRADRVRLDVAVTDPAGDEVPHDDGSAGPDTEVTSRSGTYWSLFAGVGRYVPQTLAPVDRPRLDSGVLDVRAARAERSRSRLRTAVETVAGRPGERLARLVPAARRHLVVAGTTTTELRLRLRGTVPGGRYPAADAVGAPDAQAAPDVVLAHDGETLSLPPTTDGTPVTLTLRPRALRVYAPTAPDDV